MKSSKPRKLRRVAVQPPLTLPPDSKSELRTQFAALCYRIREGKVQVLLVTSRGRQRWILPKGWPMEGQTPAEAAAQEAWEEGGVRGKVIEHCLGVFPYEKTVEDGDNLQILTMVYPVRVKALVTSFPERAERRRKWFSPRKAAKKVAEPALAQILQTFDPTRL